SMPYIGLFIILVWGVADATAGWAKRTRFLAAGAALLLGACGVLSFTQVRYWRDTETLWRHNLAVTPDNGTAHEGLGLELMQDGNFKEAREHLHAAIGLGRHSTRTHGNLALDLQKLSHLDGEREQYRLALPIDPNSVAAHFGLAEVLSAQRRYAEAREHLEAAVRLDPNSYAGHRDLALVLNRLGLSREALAECDK